MKAYILLFTVVLAFSVAPTAQSAIIQYISPSQQHALEEMFNKSSFSELDHHHELVRSRWLCDMFGARSRLQVEHGLHLYRFSPEGHGQWRNSGTQIVSNYRVKNEMLVGQTARFQDSLRITRDGRLISKLTTRDAGGGQVVAYSLCHSLTE